MIKSNENVEAMWDSTLPCLCEDGVVVLRTLLYPRAVSTHYYKLGNCVVAEAARKELLPVTRGSEFELKCTLQ